MVRFQRCVKSLTYASSFRVSLLSSAKPPLPPPPPPPPSHPCHRRHHRHASSSANRSRNVEIVIRTRPSGAERRISSLSRRLHREERILYPLKRTTSYVQIPVRPLPFRPRLRRGIALSSSFTPNVFSSYFIFYFTSGSRCR